jgi:hypothetical protein
MAKKPCRFCMRVRELLTKYLNRRVRRVNNLPDRRRVPHTRPSVSESGKGPRKNRGYIQGDSLLTVIILVGLLMLLLYFLR